MELMVLTELTEPKVRLELMEPTVLMEPKARKVRQVVPVALEQKATKVTTEQLAQLVQPGTNGDQRPERCDRNRWSNGSKR